MKNIFANEIFFLIRVSEDPEEELALLVFKDLKVN